jgi:parallel beta-helix repeat protein
VTCAIAAAVAPATALAADRHVYSGQSLSAAISAAAAGDTVVVHAGSYPQQRLSSQFSAPVVVTAEAGDSVNVAGFTFSGAHNIHVRELRINGMVRAENSSALRFDDVVVDPGESTVDGFRFNDYASDIVVSESRVVSGRFNVYFWGPSPAAWPERIRVVHSELTGASADNVQIGGGRDITLGHNYIHDPLENSDHNDGVQAIASDGLKLVGNTVSTPASPAVGGPDQGILLGRADPPEADRLVENSVVVNNLVHHWRGIGIMLAGTDNTLVANNTAYANGTDGTWSGLSLVSKNNPADFANTRVRVVNNVLNRMSVANGSERPEVEEFNLVREGGAGTALLTSDPQFVDGASLNLRATSPAVNTGTSTYAPTNDIDGLLRDPLVDRGASEYGAVAEGLAPSPVTVIEGEAMSLPSGGAVRLDPTASGGRVLERYSVSTSTARISLAAPATSLVVRARGSQCSGAPRMIVTVDGATVLDASVTSTSLANYRAAVTLPAGGHDLSVRFPNDYLVRLPIDYLATGCDRNLYVDKLTFVQ